MEMTQKRFIEAGRDTVIVSPDRKKGGLIVFFVDTTPLVE